MADPASIIGLTSSIITFIDFGIKVVSLAKTIRESHDGALVLPHSSELNLIIDDVRALIREVREKKLGPGQPAEDDRLLVSMAAECERLATRLRLILDTLKVREGAWSKTLEVGRVLFHTVTKKSDIEDIRQRLDSLGSRLRDGVGLAFQRDAVEHGKESLSAISAELKALSQLQKDLGINYDTKLDDIRTEIVSIAKAHQPEAAAAQLARLNECLGRFEEERTRRRERTALIKSLYFPEIRRRWGQIPDADAETNMWLFDRTKTNFESWLRSGNGIFWFAGKAGSGKSTLMKFISEHEKTQEALMQWAHPAKPFCPAFYFWNQGFEMQKSQAGLFQSIVYQILRSVPDIIPLVCPERLHHERWEVEDLRRTLREILKLPQNSLSVRFCFFIDGLDEYNGDEEDLIKALAFFGDTPNVKLCVSSRPRPFLDKIYQHRRQTLVIHEFTKEDMRTHVRQGLEMNERFRGLQQTFPRECNDLLTQIADRAQGVWLWVYLVTHDLVHAVNRSEGIYSLQKILNKFPGHLEAYFEHIIQQIKDPFREEMAQIFLITTEEVQPLPLFAFTLLEHEAKDSSYAISAPISPISNSDAEEIHRSWKERTQNRCGDLLVVSDGEHPTFLLHPVDFLHRTVRDFLRDCYYEKLLKEVPLGFRPLISLCRMMLFLLKSLPIVEVWDGASATRLIQIADELLYYAYEAEKRIEPGSDCSPVTNMLDEVDRVNIHNTQAMDNHWTHMRDSPSTRGYDEYREGGNCNFLALAVQTRLIKYVKAKLDEDPGQMKKAGRPLLDYALRPRRITPISMPYHSQREETSIDVAMVQLLLERGANPNQPVHLNDSQPVWVLFLLSCYETTRRKEASAALRAAWYNVSEMLISHGAELNPRNANARASSRRTPLTVLRILQAVFGEKEAGQLKIQMEEIEAARPRTSWIKSIWRLGSP